MHTLTSCSPNLSPDMVGYYICTCYLCSHRNWVTFISPCYIHSCDSDEVGAELLQASQVVCSDVTTNRYIATMIE